MSRVQTATLRESSLSRSTPPRVSALSTLERSASAPAWSHAEIDRQSCGHESEEVSVRDLRERADRARADLYVEACKHRGLVPQARALIREAQELCAELRTYRMRNFVLVAEIKMNLLRGSGTNNALAGSGQPTSGRHKASVQ